MNTYFYKVSSINFTKYLNHLPIQNSLNKTSKTSYESTFPKI